MGVSWTSRSFAHASWRRRSMRTDPHSDGGAGSRRRRVTARILAGEAQLALTELLLCEEVDRLIFSRLRLPSYQTWRPGS